MRRQEEPAEPSGDESESEASEEDEVDVQYCELLELDVCLSELVVTRACCDKVEVAQCKVEKRESFFPVFNSIHLVLIAAWLCFIFCRCDACQGDFFQRRTTLGQIDPNLNPPEGTLR